MSDLKTHIYVQARMESTRLPGKVTKPVLQKSLLEYLVERVSRCKEADKIVVLTSQSKADDAIELLCQKLHVECFRGPHENVLERFFLASEKYQPDLIVRITGDCPLIDPEIVDNVIKKYKGEFPKWDYVSNTINRKYARGMDVEVFSKKALDTTYKAATNSFDQEHVTRYMYMHPDRFHIGSVEKEKDDSHLRLTVDTEEDFQLTKLLLENLYPLKKDFSYADVLTLLSHHPEWLTINAHIKQKSC